jgi:hypothetical protein
MDNIAQDIERIKKLWEAGFPNYPLAHTQFANWVSRYGFFTAKHGIEKTFRKAAALSETMTQLHAVRYANKVMENKNNALADVPITRHDLPQEATI